MGFLKKLSQLFTPSNANRELAYWVYVQCDRCGEKLRARVDLRNDLSAIFAEEGTTYFCRKVVMGEGRCYQKIDVELTFDQNRNLLERQIQGGKFISAEENRPGE